MVQALISLKWPQFKPQVTRGFSHLVLKSLVQIPIIIYQCKPTESSCVTEDLHWCNWNENLPFCIYYSLFLHRCVSKARFPHTFTVSARKYKEIQSSWGIKAYFCHDYTKILINDKGYEIVSEICPWNIRCGNRRNYLWHNSLIYFHSISRWPGKTPTRRHWISESDKPQIRAPPLSWSGIPVPECGPKIPKWLGLQEWQWCVSLPKPSSCCGFTKPTFFFGGGTVGNRQPPFPQ